MNLYEALGQALHAYEIIPLTEDNFTKFREVFDTNHDFLVEGYGKLIDEKGVFGAIAQLVDGFNPADKYLAAICQKDKVAAAVDLLANLPAEGQLYLSFLVVNNDFKGKGIGTAIADGIVVAAKMVGFTKISLGSFEDTAGFWRKQGFVQTGSSGDFLAFYKELA